MADQGRAEPMAHDTSASIGQEPRLAARSTPNEDWWEWDDEHLFDNERPRL